MVWSKCYDGTIYQTHNYMSIDVSEEFECGRLYLQTLREMYLE